MIDGGFLLGFWHIVAFPWIFARTSGKYKWGRNSRVDLDQTTPIIGVVLVFLHWHTPVWVRFGVVPFASAALDSHRFAGTFDGFK